MPPKHYSEKFKYDIDDYGITEELPDEAFREDMQELKLEKLGHRVTLITILIPILIVVIIVVSYLDITQKVAQTQTTGTMGVQNLSKDLQSRFSSLSVRQAKLEDNLQKQTTALEEDWAQYAVQRKKIEDSITTLSQQMANKTELASTAKQFNSALETLQTEISTTQTKLAKAEEAATKSLNRSITIAEETQQQFDKISQTVSTLTEQKLDRNQLDLALKIRDLKLNEQFQEQSNILEKEIASLKETSDRLSKELNVAIERIKEIASSQAAQEKKAENSSQTSSKPESSPTEGNIVEQDLN